MTPTSPQALNAGRYPYAYYGWATRPAPRTGAGAAASEHVAFTCILQAHILHTVERGGWLQGYMRNGRLLPARAAQARRATLAHHQIRKGEKRREERRKPR